MLFAIGCCECDFCRRCTPPLAKTAKQYVSKLADNLNAEIVQGTVQSVAEAAQWLGYTYLYVRMMQNPGVYRVPPDQLDKDPVLLQFRVDLVSQWSSLLLS